MNRREAIKNISISFGSITLSTAVLSMIQSCQTDNIDWSPDYFKKNQINFIDVLCKRLGINAIKCLENLDLSTDINGLSHSDGVSIIRKLSSYQQDTSAIPETVLGYEEDWK